MNKWYDAFQSLSPLWKLALYATAFSLACVIVFLPLYLTKMNELKAIQSQIREVENNLREGKDLQARCDLPTDEEKKLWSEVRDNLFKRIPPEKRLLQLVKDIASVADDCSIHDIAFTMPDSQMGSVVKDTTRQRFPNAPAERSTVSPDLRNQMPDAQLQTLTIRTDFHCAYQALAHFLKGINALDRLLEVESLVIKRRLPLMEVELAIHAFYTQEGEDA